MQAAQIKAYGGQDVVTVGQTTKPVVGINEAIVEVYAAGVDPFDYKLRDGKYKDYINLKFPATLGGDVAGVISELGPETKGFSVGQAIFGSAGAASGQGSFAEYVNVKVSQLAAKPTTLDFVQAGALPLTSCSAYQALVEHMQLMPGQKILIHGGAGGIGSMAIQMAKNIGAYVATTASADDASYVKSLGADEVIDYKNQDFSQIIHNYDAVFDTVGGEVTDKSYLVLKPKGHLVSMLSKPSNELVQKYQIRFTQEQAKVTTERLDQIAKLVDGGQLKVHLDKVFPLVHAAEALEHLKTNHPRGKVVIKLK